METRSNEAFLLYGNSTIQEYPLPSKIIQAFLLYKHQWIFHWILHLCCSHSDKRTPRLANFSWKWSILQYFSALSNNIVIRIVWRSNLHYGKLSDVNTICQKQFGHAFICVFAWLYHIMKFNTVATMPHIASRLIQWRWLNSPQQERKKEGERKNKKEKLTQNSDVSSIEWNHNFLLSYRHSTEDKNWWSAFEKFNTFMDISNDLIYGW